MDFRLAFLYLTLNHFKGQSQGYAYFDNEYLGNGDRYVKNYYFHQIASHVWTFDWKTCMYISTMNFFEAMRYRVHYYCHQILNHVWAFFSNVYI